MGDKNPKKAPKKKQSAGKPSTMQEALPVPELIKKVKKEK